MNSGGKKVVNMTMSTTGKQVNGFGVDAYKLALKMC